MISLGTSASDHVPARGHIDPAVYARVDYIEYGGHFPLLRDAGVERLRATGRARMTRHLVSTELAAELDIAAEAARILGELEGYTPEYLVSDFGYWRLSGRDAVEICLDISHLIQFARNVNGQEPELPRWFPWQKIAEIHMAGYVMIEYQGQIRYIDEHLADIPDHEYALMMEVIERRGSPGSLDICLEMEPRSAASYQAIAARLHQTVGRAS